MDIGIQIDESYSAMIDANQIKEAMRATLRLCPGPRTKETDSVALAITDDETVRQLNHRYRGVDEPTDVLSFENLPDPDFPNEEATVHLGDVIIAFPVAAAQATAAGHAISEEIILLTVHGTLHLLGFDHDTPTGKKNMWSIQRQIMTELGLPYVQPPVD